MIIEQLETDNNIVIEESATSHTQHNVLQMEMNYPLQFFVADGPEVLFEKERIKEDVQKNSKELEVVQEVSYEEIASISPQNDIEGHNREIIDVEGMEMIEGTRLRESEDTVAYAIENMIEESRFSPAYPEDALAEIETHDSSISTGTKINTFLDRPTSSFPKTKGVSLFGNEILANKLKQRMMKPKPSIQSSFLSQISSHVEDSTVPELESHHGSIINGEIHNPKWEETAFRHSFDQVIAFLESPREDIELTTTNAYKQSLRLIKAKSFTNAQRLFENIIRENPYEPFLQNSFGLFNQLRAEQLQFDKKKPSSIRKRYELTIASLKKATEMYLEGNITKPSGPSFKRKSDPADYFQCLLGMVRCNFRLERYDECSEAFAQVPEEFSDDPTLNYYESLVCYAQEEKVRSLMAAVKASLMGFDFLRPSEKVEEYLMDVDPGHWNFIYQSLMDFKRSDVPFLSIPFEQIYKFCEMQLASPLEENDSDASSVENEPSSNIAETDPKLNLMKRKADTPVRETRSSRDKSQKTNHPQSPASIPSQEHGKPKRKYARSMKLEIEEVKVPVPKPPSVARKRNSSSSTSKGKDSEDWIEIIMDDESSSSSETTTTASDNKLKRINAIPKMLQSCIDELVVAHNAEIQRIQSMNGSHKSKITQLKTENQSLRIQLKKLQVNEADLARIKILENQVENLNGQLLLSRKETKMLQDQLRLMRGKR